MSVTGTAGKPITIKCSHSYATTNVKYFCKGACNYEDVLIKSNDVNRDKNGKYCIKDDGNTFSVTISNLEMSDEGIYWCGIERAGVDTYNKVNLRVVDSQKLLSGHPFANLQDVPLTTLRSKKT
ncbi:hypothetical protein GOODEAATRI_030615 [Goodea atripinnis]|uniref:Ig-like domain-containing protein n=1 Tax=Goodea atripinnis TaxID=208336 RepID=A0ABV0N5P1_9TELE